MATRGRASGAEAIWQILPLKLSTATGYVYGYVQDLESGMWQYIILDFETGETVFTMDVSNKPGYNNMAIGMYAGNSGNALYCPTGYLELLRLQDRFVYLPEMPYREVDLDQALRNVLSQEAFEADGGEGSVPSWLKVERFQKRFLRMFSMRCMSP